MQQLFSICQKHVHRYHGEHFQGGLWPAIDSITPPAMNAVIQVAALLDALMFWSVQR